VKFPIVTYEDQQFGLLLIEPNWDTPIEVAHRCDTLIGEGRTSIEERYPERAALGLSLKMHLTATDTDADDWRKGLAALGNLPVAIPFWPDARPVADWANRIYDPQKVINFDRATGSYAIYDTSSLPGSPAYPLYAPLMLCRWKERPPAQPETTTVCEIDLDLSEARPWAWRIGLNSYGSSWVELPDWADPLSDASDHGVELIELNPVVAPALDRTSSAARWKQDAKFTFTDSLAIRQALTFFVAKKGATLSWYPVPAWFQPGTPTDDTPANYTARFASDTLTLSYINPTTAEGRIGFIQEVGGGAQSKAAKKYLFRFSYAQDPSTPECYTDWDAPLTVGAEVYNPFQISCDGIIRSLKPQDEKADIKMAYLAGTLAADWIPGRLFGVVILQIWECDPATPSARKLIFTGFITAVSPEGNTLTVTATLFGTLLDRRLPSWVYGPCCNTYVFSPLCTLVEATYRSSGTAARADLSSDGLTLAVHGVTGWGGPTYAANWFASGILRTGSGRQMQIVTIIASSYAGGILTLTLNRPLWADLLAVGGQSVQLVPGCDGQASTCTGKFGNYANFRGMPFIPQFLAVHEVGAPATSKK
jgi:uncharacterized phage protein (TIGR02218 family)